MVKLVHSLACLLLLGLLCATEVRAQDSASANAGRYALLIGNPLHAGSTLPRSPSFQPIADRLTKLGFTVTTVENAGKARMNEAIRVFAGKVRSGSTALFLFRGAMLRLGQKNYLIPADAQGASEDDARATGIDLSAIESDLSKKGAAIKVIIIDASRSDLVADQFGVAPSGPAALELHDGTLAILNAATQDRRAESREDDVFLAELLRQTSVPDVTVEQAFARTRVAVAKASGGRQVPSVSSSLLTDFSFSAPPGSAPPPAVEPAAERPASDDRPKAPAGGSGASASAEKAPVAAPSGMPEPGEIFRDCDTCPEMVVVPSGDFTMGGGDTEYEKPAHKVTIAAPFAIGRYEVTFAEWDACVADKACKGDIDDHGFGRDRQPVIDVTWDEAKAYVKWLAGKTGQAYRLPSEAEWEYGARAGSRSIYSWGASLGSGRANCSDCSSSPARATMAVGSFRPNAFGLFDTAGNAAEWVEDCWNGGYKSAPANGAAWTSGQCQLRVLRGGAFGTKSTAVRSAARFRYDRDVRYYTNGFRVARDLK